MSEPCRFPSLDRCQKRFLWTNKEVDLASHLVVSLVLKIADWAKCPQTMGLESLDPFLKVSLDPFLKVSLDPFLRAVVAAYRINVVGQWYVAYGPATIGNECVVVMA